MLNRLSVCNQHNKNCAEQTLNRGYPHGINSSALTDFLLINSGLKYLDAKQVSYIFFLIKYIFYRFLV